MRRALAILLAAALTAAAASALATAAPAGAMPVITRIAGADRYETAANVSAHAFAPGVAVAFVATGENYPDALSAAAAAAKLGGPVLLTRAASLPASTAAELDRLAPGRIVVVGGPGAVSAAVEAQLGSHTSGAVQRIQGQDRYATAVAVSAASFPAHTDTVYVATGANFPDALAGSPAAGSAPGGAPLLLLPYDQVQARTDVVAELQRLAPQHLVILGGSSAVTQVQTNQLGSFSAQPVVRLSGTDRTLTSVAVSSAAFSSASTVYLATGANFPDALAGGSPASAAGAPILLVQPTCIPAAVDAEIDRLGAQTIQVLGGEAALSAAVTQRTVCGAGASEATPPPSGPCGSTVYKAGGAAWQCSFADEFSGSTLDTSHWVVQTTAQSGFHNGPECFVNTPDNLSVGGGTLSLTVRKEAAPFTCAAASAGSYTSQYTSGMVMTAGLFSQTYGRFEVRAKLPAAKVKGLQESFWLWPDNPYKYGTAWPRSGEIDIAEIYHLYPDRAIPYVHYVPGVADPNVTNNYCLIDDVTKFHTYTAEWTPTTITIKYDGVTCLVDTLVAAAPLLVGQPFDQPFMVALTQALGIGSNAFDANTPLPATTQVDYVRIWK